MSKIFKIKLKKGDKVIVRAGKYKGQIGKIIATHPRINSATVDGINIVKRHIKPNKAYPQGGIIDVTKPINVSKLSVVDPSTNKGTRVGYKLTNDGSRIRIYKSSGKEIK